MSPAHRFMYRFRAFKTYLDTLYRQVREHFGHFLFYQRSVGKNRYTEMMPVNLLKNFREVFSEKRFSACYIKTCRKGNFVYIRPLPDCIGYVLYCTSYFRQYHLCCMLFFLVAMGAGEITSFREMPLNKKIEGIFVVTGLIIFHGIRLRNRQLKHHIALPACQTLSCRPATLTLSAFSFVASFCSVLSQTLLNPIPE